MTRGGLLNVDEVTNFGAQLEMLDEALSNFAEKMAHIEEGAGHLSCSEAMAIEEILRLTGHDSEADAFIEFHAHGDDDVDDEHHARYLEIMGEHEQMDAEIHAARRAELTRDQR